MSKTIIARFNVAEFAQQGNGGGAKVTLFPCTNSNENSEFWEKNPNGVIKLHLDNEVTQNFFKEMGEVVLTFSREESMISTEA